MLATSSIGRLACIEAGSVTVLTALAGKKSFYEVMGRIVDALLTIAVDDAGKQACIAADALSVLTILAQEPAVKSNTSVSTLVRLALQRFRE